MGASDGRGYPLPVVALLSTGEQVLNPREFRELIRVMRSHSTYVNVHTEGCSQGEIRGQILAHADSAKKEKDDE